MNNFIMNVYNDSYIDLSICQSGREKCSPGHSFGPARRSHYLFHYVLSGSGTLYSDDIQEKNSALPISAGDGFLICPDQITMYVADSADPWEYIWIEFDGLRVKENLESIGLTKNDPIYRADDPDCCKSMMNEMLYIISHPEDSIFHVLGHLYLFFDYFIRSRSQTKSPGRRMKDYYIRKALDYIDANYQNRISVESIAQVCGIDRSYFCKLFRSAFGKPPQAFLMNYRMNKASSLLRETDLPVSDVARRSGYENPLHFSRAFKKIYGLPPREWRNAQK